MVVGEIPDSVDFLVVGGGPGGYVAALAAAGLGRKVVVVDVLGEAGLGGVCVNVGCIPSKALIELAHATHELPRWQGRGLNATGTVDMAEFQQWKGQVVSGLNSGVRQLFKAAGITVLQGFFRFTRKDQGAVEFGDERPPIHLRFNSCVVASGSRPASIPALKHDGVRVLDSTDVLNLDYVPNSAVIVGGGYIGIELGTALAKVGSKVTIVEALPKVLPQLPAHIVSPVTKRLTELGVALHLNTSVIADTGKSLTVSCDGIEREIESDIVVVCVGRKPNTQDLGLEVLGVKPNEQGLLDVGSDLLISPKVAAIGDITTGPALAHKASAQGHVAAEILSGHAASYSPLAIPAVVFSDPEIAMTGLTVEQALEQGLVATAAMFPIAASGRARTMNETAGVSQLVHTSDGVIIGAQLVGPHVSEFIAEVTLAIELGATLEDFSATIHPHPTVSETLVESALVGLGRPIHVVAKRPRT